VSWKKGKIFGRFCCVSATPFGFFWKNWQWNTFGRKIGLFWTQQFLDWTRLAGSRFANRWLSHISKKMLSSRWTKKKRFKTQKLDKKETKFEIIWKNWKKEFCAGNQKMSPRTGKKTKKFAEKIGNFFGGKREEEKRNLHTREKKMSGFFWVFVHPSLFRWRVFARKLNNGGIKENILRKQNKEFCEKEEEEKKKEITTLPYLNVTSRIVYV
jgi:hypothetical protein